MPKPRGRRHEWDRNSPFKGYATCAHCSLGPIKHYKIRKGGLPTCDEYLSSPTQKTLDEIGKAVCMLSNKLNPIIACFFCSGRLDPKKCEKLRAESGYYKKIGKSLDLRNQKIAPMVVA